MKTEDMLRNLTRAFAPFAAQMRKQWRAWWARMQDMSGNNMALAKDYMVQGAYTDAIFRYRIVTTFFPRHADAWAGLAESYRLDNQPEKAKAAAIQALTIQPGHPVAMQVRALLQPQASAPPSTPPVPSPSPEA